MTNACACGCCAAQFNIFSDAPEGENHPPCPLVRKRRRRSAVRHVPQDGLARQTVAGTPAHVVALPPITKVAA